MSDSQSKIHSILGQRTVKESQCLLQKDLIIFKENRRKTKLNQRMYEIILRRLVQ
jgi:hypothetical protein